VHRKWMGEPWRRVVTATALGSESERRIAKAAMKRR
jgi:hypothetical protein